MELTATRLKLLAIIAMTCDHFAYGFLPPDSAANYVLRLIGRLTAPIMAFMLAEGFRYTHSHKRYLFRLLFFAMIAQPFYYVYFYGVPARSIDFLSKWNVLFTLAVSLLMLMVRDSKRMPGAVKGILIGVLLLLAGIGDWSVLIPAWAMVFASDQDWKRKCILFCMVSVPLLILVYLPEYISLLSFAKMFGVLLALVPLSLYHGKQGAGGWKRFFYWFYPGHIGMMLMLRYMVF